jgi:hypothetical protein
MQIVVSQIGIYNSEVERSSQWNPGRAVVSGNAASRVFASRSGCLLFRAVSFRAAEDEVRDDPSAFLDTAKRLR